MKGDFSRIRFSPANQYTSVLKQQGRVDLDADANEQRFIDNWLRDRINTDVIGPYGGPEDNAGFAVQISANDILIEPGRYYVDGILVENLATVSYDHQPWLIDPSSNASALLQQLLNGGQHGSLTFVLEVWQRMVTALDDTCLREPALGQADTTTRLQTVWRVIGSYNSGPTEPATPPPAENAIKQLSPCCQALYTNRLFLPIRGRMGAGLQQAGSGCGCQPIAAAGYQGLENQLYRVEIHQGGNINKATFKWSRENASVVTTVNSIGVKSPIITVASLGPDANLGFQAGQWVELTDNSYQFSDLPNQSGQLFKIVSTNPAALQVTLDNPVYGIDTRLNPRMRRWDQPKDAGDNTGIRLSASPITLENGIQVWFSSEGTYQAGDYWTIPARTANGQIDWPPCESDGNILQGPDSVEVHRAPVACVQLRSEINDIFRKGITGTAQDKTLVNDCRLLFPPLTAVNPDAVPPALHVNAVSWTNDDIITVDTLVAAGLSVTFDQPTTCPWGGGNFQVQFEVPFTSGDQAAVLDRSLPGTPKATFSYPPGTDCFIRTVLALDPPWGIVVSGSQVNWMTAYPVGGNVNYAAYAVLEFLNVALRWQQPIGFGRVRIRLIGSSVYATGTNGNIYLDGQSFGVSNSRAIDGSPSVALKVPSGDSLAVSDYEGWFYLAPTVYVVSVVIQGTSAGQEVTVTSVTVSSDTNNQVTGLSLPTGAVVTQLQALITLSYAPVAPTTVNLTFSPVSGATASGAASIASSVQVPAGQLTITTPVNVVSNPGAGNIDVVSLLASVPVLQTTVPVQSPPQLSLVGSAPQTIHRIPITFNNPTLK